MRPPLRLCILLLLAGSVLPASRVHAAWPAGLTLESVYGSSWGIAEGYLLPGAAPGELYALGCSGTYYHWGVHRFTTDGVSSYVTPLNGSFQCEPGPSYFSGGFGFAPDGAGGFLHAYKQCYSTASSLRSAHVDAAGTLFPASGQIGYAVDSAYSRPAALPAPGGGAWYAWVRDGIRLMRVDETGAKLPDWPDRGWLVPGLPSPEAFGLGTWLASDDAGGLFVAVADTVLRVQRLGPDTTVVPGWPAAGLPLRVPGGTVFMDPRATIVPSGDPWYFAAWIEGPGPFDIYLQRFSRDGIVDPAWPAGGLKVGTATLSLASWLFRCFPDGSGGVTLSWVEDAGNQANVYACRVLADGSYANGYPGGARLLAVLDLYRIRPATLGVAVCPGRNGGLFVGWVARLNAQTFEHALRGRWYGAGGAPDPSPALYESDLGPDVPGQDEITALAAHPDSGGGAYVLLSCNGEAYPSSFAVVAHVTQHSLADVPKPPGARTLALAVSPNPARGAFSANFTLPDDRPARLELLDVNGRRVWSRDVRGAGARTLAVEPRETLAPGVYLLRLTHAGAGRTARVAILH